jgi:hypothetical protein
MENEGAQPLLLNQVLWNEQNNVNNNNNNNVDLAMDMEDEEVRDGDGALDGGVAKSGSSDDDKKERSTVSTDMELVRFQLRRLRYNFYVKCLTFAARFFIWSAKKFLTSLPTILSSNQG